MRFGVILLFLCYLPFVYAKQAEIQVNQSRYTVELAQTLAERQQGLQGRDSLCSQCGMLFQFSPARTVGFWMKNTTIPLDIAFINSAMIITAIKPLTPLDLTTISSDSPVTYAWEMNRGWFSNNQIKVGDSVQISH